jgi:hypothetical protein
LTGVRGITSSLEGPLFWNKMRRLVLCFLIASLSVMVWGLSELWVESRTLTWREVPALVTKSKVVVVATTTSVNHSAVPSDRKWYAWDFEYAYKVDGFDYRSGRAGLLDNPILNKRAAEARATTYPVGATVRARVSPDDPAIAVLEPGFSPTTVILVIASVLAATGAYWMLRGMPPPRLPYRRRGDLA